jgi:hypothetical protein
MTNNEIWNTLFVFVNDFLWLEDALLQLIKRLEKFDIRVHDLTCGLQVFLLLKIASHPLVGI